MRKHNELSRRSFSNFGFSTILIAFVMICIVTFSALALMTANSDYKLSQKVADRTHNYYQAEKDATIRLQQIDTILSKAYAKSSNRTTYYTLARKNLKSTDLAITLADTSSSTLSLSYEITIGNHQSLHVDLRVVYPPESGGTYYELTNWDTITDLFEDTEGTLNLIGNE